MQADFFIILGYAILVFAYLAKILKTPKPKTPHIDNPKKTDYNYAAITKDSDGVINRRLIRKSSG